VTVVNPIGLPPLALGRYRPLADLPAVSEEGGVTGPPPALHPDPAHRRAFNPRMICRAVLPLAQRLHAEARSTWSTRSSSSRWPRRRRDRCHLGLPLSIKARGADISLLGRKALARARCWRRCAQAAGLLAVSRDLAGHMAAMGMPPTRSPCTTPGWTVTASAPGPTQRSGLAAELGFAMPDGPRCSPAWAR
jgi:teichuronic acid biosynthesis glycosyltransferase TuaC